MSEVPMKEYIEREEALTFELDVEAESAEELQAIMKGMALYADYLKSLPSILIAADEEANK